MVKIAPSVLSVDFSKLSEQVKMAVDGGADWIHLDVMDGHFVPNITFGPFIIEGIRKLTDLPLDVHLMIENADRYLADFKNAGADYITVHCEACPHLWSTIDTIHELGVNAGVTLNPATPIQLLDPVLERVDLVLVMSVEPGFGGQKFIKQSVEKISYLSDVKQAKGYNYEIEVDGGIDPNTAKLVSKAGATVLVAGSSVFKSANIPAAIDNLRQSAQLAKLAD